jgi:hypothetical protein
VRKAVTANLVTLEARLDAASKLWIAEGVLARTTVTDDYDAEAALGEANTTPSSAIAHAITAISAGTATSSSSAMVTDDKTDADASEIASTFYARATTKAIAVGTVFYFTSGNFWLLDHPSPFFSNLSNKIVKQIMFSVVLLLSLSHNLYFSLFPLASPCLFDKSWVFWPDNRTQAFIK